MDFPVNRGNSKSKLSLGEVAIRVTTVNENDESDKSDGKLEAEGQKRPVAVSAETTTPKTCMNFVGMFPSLVFDYYIC